MVQVFIVTCDALARRRLTIDEQPETKLTDLRGEAATKSGTTQKPEFCQKATHFSFLSLSPFSQVLRSHHAKFQLNRRRLRVTSARQQHKNGPKSLLGHFTFQAVSRHRQRLLQRPSASTTRLNGAQRLALY